MARILDLITSLPSAVRPRASQWGSRDKDASKHVQSRRGEANLNMSENKGAGARLQVHALVTLSLGPARAVTKGRKAREPSLKAGHGVVPISLISTLLDQEDILFHVN